jgi:hypothetical protein
MSACPYKQRVDARPCQGAIYQNLITFLPESPPDPEPKFARWELPYAVALSQECDLLQDHNTRLKLKESAVVSPDFKHDKLLPTILLCPAYPASSLHTGDHMKDLRWKMESYTSSQWSLIKQNNNSRYHYLVGWANLQVPELVIDFKHFFVMQTELMIDHDGDEAHYLARLGYLYREDLSHRFAAYLARIGLPVSHHEFPQITGTQPVGDQGAPSQPP